MYWIGIVLIVFLTVDNARSIHMELWNEQIDLMLYLFETAAKEKTTNLEFIPGPNLNAANISLSGMKLGLMWSLKRDSDVFMEIPKEGDVRIVGRFALKNFKLLVNRFKYNSFNGPANITAARSSLSVSYQIKDINKPRLCQMEWEVFKLNPFKSLILLSKDPKYNNIDITEEINKKFIPEINMYFKSSYFQKYLNNYWNFCFSKFFK